MSEVKRYSAQPFSPNGLMFENEFGHYVLFCEYEKLKAENEKLKKRLSGLQHNHINRDIKDKGECPACDRYHEKSTITKITRQRDRMKRTLEHIIEVEKFLGSGKSVLQQDCEKALQDAELE